MPKEAAVAVIVGDDRKRSGGDCGDGKRTEVAGVEAVRDADIHEEYLVLGERATAPPSG